MQRTSFVLFFLISLFGISIALPACANAPSSNSPSDFPVLRESGSGFLSLNTLRVIFDSVIVDNRETAEISFKDATVDCTPVWNQVYDNETSCLETYTANIDWAMLAEECGLVRTDLSNTIEFKGTIIVHQVDHLAQIRGESISRDMYSPFDFVISFPRNIQVNTSELAIFAPISVQTAIIKKEYDQSTHYGHFQLYTSVQYPFILENPSISVNNGGLNVFILQNSVVSCPTSGPGACNVIYDIYVNATTLCNLNGTYTSHFTIGCQSGADCPLDGDSVDIQFVGASNDFCGEFGVNVDLTIGMASYKSDYSTAKDSFLQEQTMYFKAVAASTKVQLIHTYLLNCSSFYNGVNTLLYSQGSYSSNGTPAPIASDAQFAVGSVDATSARFSLKATDALFTLAADASGKAVLNCWVGVDYLDAVSKRSVSVVQKRQQQISGSANQASTSFNISPVETVENSSPILVSSAVLSMVLGLVALF